MTTTPNAATEPASPWYIAQDENDVDSLVLGTTNTLKQAQDHGYDLLTVSITTSDFHSKIFQQTSLWSEHPPGEFDLSTEVILSPLSPEDTNLAPADANSALIGKISPWIDLASEDPLIAHVSRQVFKLELAYAAFCGLQNIIVHGPTSGGDVVNYSRVICEGIGVGPYISLHILLPMSNELEHEHAGHNHLSELSIEAPDHDEIEEDEFNAWDIWDKIRTICTYSPRLGIALEVPRQLPSLPLQSRWYSEPVRLLVYPRTTFLRNAKGYPVLHKTQQQYLTRMMRLRFPPWLVLTDVIDRSDQSASSIDMDPTPSEAASTPTPRSKRDPVPHLRYIRHLQQSQPLRTPIERFGHGFQDYIQSPLQPLTDNLESITYEVFEKDPVKYDWYERATKLALQDLHQRLGRTLLVAVVGSGRGPLVSKALLAAKDANVPILCWAVEKNPNAYVHLLRRNATDELWNGQVNVVKTDMRAWKGPVIDGQLSKLDVMISELLGSFADNELSPECLDGVQHVLHPEHGVNIPQSYSAHFTPLSSPRLHNDLLSRPGSDKWEIPAVVMLQQQDFLSMQAKSDSRPVVREAWSFSHPLPAKVLDRARLRAGGSAQSGGPGGQDGGDGSNEHNSKYCKRSFPCKYQGVCHGIAGYFETVLYSSPVTDERVELSTSPLTMESKSENMISWFPIFFPLKTPLYVQAQSTIEISMWRATDDRKVWYEWIVEVFATTDNGQRRGPRLAMSELHSSRKHGCLM